MRRNAAQEASIAKEVDEKTAEREARIESEIKNPTAASGSSRASPPTDAQAA